MRQSRIWFWLVIFFSLISFSKSFANGEKSIPSIENVLDEIRSAFPKKERTKSLEQMLFETKKFYYQIQYQKQKLGILKEVKGHFEKAVGKIEEKYDEGEEDIDQSEITKIKLGLAGTLNDIYEVETDLQISRLSLSEILGNKYPPNAKLLESDIVPVEFQFDSFFSWLKDQSISSKANKRLLILRKSFLKVVEASKKMKLARKNRKMTRALLVSEVANYDFGVGESGDLFQALIIYTRVLSGYYNSVYKFNLSVAILDRDKNL